MSIKEATPAEIAAMRQRLRARQEERSFDRENDEAISLVRSRRTEAPQEAERPTREIPAARKITPGCVLIYALSAVLRNWLFALALGMAVFAAAVIV